jgi:hypothetical protein
VGGLNGNKPQITRQVFGIVYNSHSGAGLSFKGMKTLTRTSVLIAALVVALPMFAQKSFAPSPSITSGTYLGYPSASILTPNNMRLGDSAPRIQNSGRFGTGAFAGHPVVAPGQKAFIPQRDHHFRNGCRNCTSYPYYPAYYAPYSYGYGYANPVMIEDNSSLPNAGTFNGSSPVYRPSVGSDSVIEEQGGRFYERTITERSSDPLPPVDLAKSQSAVTPAVSANGNEENDVRTLLIFKDGRRLEVSNYAIMGTTVYVFAGDRRKIPLADLDVDATIKANEERGTDFHVPPS